MSRGGFSRTYIPPCLDEIIPRKIKVAAVVNVNDLLEKYQALFAENKALKDIIFDNTTFLPVYKNDLLFIKNLRSAIRKSYGTEASIY